MYWFGQIDFFKLNSKDSKIKAAGAGATEMFLQNIELKQNRNGSWSRKNIKLSCSTS